MLVHRVLVHFKLIDIGDIGLSQSISERQAVVLVQEVDRRARSALVSLHDADAVLFNKHGQLHMA